MSVLNIQIFQHVPFEGPAAVEPYIKKRGHQVEVKKLFDGDKAEPLSADALIVMGGPMGARDEDKFAWLVEEKQALEVALKRDIPILGICLGAQLLADVLGAEVKPMGYREIGWFPVQASSDFLEHPLGRSFPRNFTPLHWHGDSFAIPQEAIALGSSEACANQGFVYGGRQVGLQFHLEFDQSSVRRLARNAADELDGSRYVQGEKEMLKQSAMFSAADQLLENFLDDFLGQCN